jgi:hypothetical protein
MVFLAFFRGAAGAYYPLPMAADTSERGRRKKLFHRKGAKLAEINHLVCLASLAPLR